MAYEEGAGQEDGRIYVDGILEKRPEGDKADDMEMYGGVKGEMDHVERTS